MKNKFLSGLIMMSAITVVLAASVKAQSNRGLTAKAESVSGDRFTVVTRTPKGAQIYAVRKPSPASLREIDKGLTDLFAVARKNGYNRFLNYSDYVVFIAKADRQKDANGNYSPDLAIGAAQYAGTDYDKGGYIYVAGMVLGYNPGAFIIGEHQQNLARISEVVRYEGEHIVLYQNNRRLYNQTADHSTGGGHPILQ